MDSLPPPIDHFWLVPGLQWVHGQELTFLWPILIFQLGCVVHVVLFRRSLWWIWIIMMVPPAGGIAYWVAESLPWFQRLDLKTILWNLKSGESRIRIRKKRSMSLPQLIDALLSPRN